MGTLFEGLPETAPWLEMEEDRLFSGQGDRNHLLPRETAEQNRETSQKKILQANSKPSRGVWEMAQSLFRMRSYRLTD